MLRTISNQVKGRRKTTSAKIITPDKLNMLFGAMTHSKSIAEIHAFFYNGRFSYFSGFGFTADYYRNNIDYNGTLGSNDPYIIARTPAEVVEYVSQFVSSCQSRTPYFSHPALQKIMSRGLMNIENLAIRLTIFEGDASTRYYIGLHEHARDTGTYRGVEMNFTTEKHSVQTSSSKT
ncbi:MAG: hypothetical protein WC613_02255 [Candidatus Aenigmatarchaeota archaeon]